MEATQSPGTALVLARPTGTKIRDWPPAVRCGGTRSDREPCGRWAVRGGDRCPMHGAQLPSVRAAYARRVKEARLRIITLADPALDTLERALTDKDSAVALRAAQAVLDRVVPRPQPGTTVVIGAGSTSADGAPVRTVSEVIRERLAALRGRQAESHVTAEPETWEGSLAKHAAVVPWDGGEAVTGEVIDPRDAGDGDWA